MQTFLPFASFRNSAAVLDNARLGKQRVEALQILRALELPEYGWQNHPAVRMWRGRTAALVAYGLSCVTEWERRGFADSTRDQIAEFAPNSFELDQGGLGDQGLLPQWLGNEEFHLSHQSRLIAKDPDFYADLFPRAPRDLDYVWPEPDAVPAPPQLLLQHALEPVWIVRAESPVALSSFLTVGVVGLGNASGVTFDISDIGLPEIKAALGMSQGRRPGRSLTALLALANEPRPGDRVGIEIEQGSRLLIGRITSGYQFQANGAPGWEHHRTASWESVIPRASVQPSAALQDVRPFFQVSADLHQAKRAEPTALVS